MPLLAKLVVALVAEYAGQRRVANNALESFVNQLMAQRGKKIDAAFADRAIGLDARLRESQPGTVDRRPLSPSLRTGFVPLDT